MSTAWVAGSVRAKALARRRLGAAGARSLAASPDLATALAALSGTPYGHDLRPEHTLAQAQHAVGATLLWHLRVLTGWLPRSGSEMTRVLSAGFEIANLDEHMQGLGGLAAAPPFRLGTLETAWSRLAGARTPAEVRDTLAASPWGDVGEPSPRAVYLGVRVAWADRVVGAAPEAALWARAATALLVARETVREGRRLPEPVAQRASYVLGPAYVAAAQALPPSPAGLARHLPGDTRWILQDVATSDGLWRAEAAWWHRVEHDGFAMLRRPAFAREPVVGSVAVLAADAWRVRAALEVPARRAAAGLTPTPTPGSADDVMEAFDGLA